MVFLGYVEGTKAYRLYDPCEDKVLVLRDVMFDEKAAWDWSSPSTGEAGSFTSTFVVEHLVIHGGGDAGEEVSSTSGRVLSTLAIVPSPPREGPSTPRRVPSTPGVEPRGPVVVATTPGRVPNTTVAEPRGLAVGQPL